MEDLLQILEGEREETRRRINRMKIKHMIRLDRMCHEFALEVHAQKLAAEAPLSFEIEMLTE